MKYHKDSPKCNGKIVSLEFAQMMGIVPGAGNIVGDYSLFANKDRIERKYREAEKYIIDKYCVNKELLLVEVDGNEIP